MSDDEARIDPRAETLEAILAGARAPLSGSDPELLELIRIANDLRDLPGRRSRHGWRRICRGGPP